MVFMTIGTNWGFCISTLQFVKVTGMNVSLDVSLVATRADIHNLLFELHLRHHFLLGLEMGIVTSGTNRIFSSVFLVFLEMIALTIFLGYFCVTTVAHDHHRHLLLAVMRPMTILAIGNIFPPDLIQHLVKIFHPNRRGAGMAVFTRHWLQGREVRDIIKIRALLIVAIETSYPGVD